MNDRPISEIMTRDLTTFSPDMSINQATDILAKKKFTGAPVVSSTNELLGMLSEKDCLKMMIDSYYNQRPSGNGLVGDYMTTTVKTIDANATIIEAAYQFVHSSYKRFPVMKDGKLVGQISRSDILSLVANMKPNVRMVPDTWKVREPMM